MLDYLSRLLAKTLKTFACKPANLTLNDYCLAFADVALHPEFNFSLLNLSFIILSQITSWLKAHLHITLLMAYSKLS